MKNREFALMLGVVLLVGSMFMVLAQPIVDSNVEETLQNQSFVRVIIEFNQSLQQNSIDMIKSEILFNLSKSEFTLRQNINDSFWFSGEITKEGLEKLKLNENIIKISKEGEGGTLNNSIRFNWLLIILPIIIILLLVLYLIIKRKK